VEKVQRIMDMRYREKLIATKQTIQYVGFEDALRNADFVSLHVPLLMPQESRNPTYHLMSEPQLHMMRKTAYLVNTSRGPIVDENALHKALLEDWIAGAALDVFEVEPLPLNSPLRDPRLNLKLRKFHHFASGARQTRLNPDPNIGMAGRTVQAVLDVLERNYDGDPKKMPYVVNKEAF
jgi:lactate dehydrogenase-like 2-hydroxyacid dehydrogenase